MKSLVVLFSLFLVCSAQAKIEVLFHPHDPTLEKIGQWISQARSTVDIAMYNMDATTGSPLVRALQTPEVQSRLQSGSLKIRMVFEGSDEVEARNKRMTAIEALGIDVRHFAKSLKVHHKFAIIDAGQPDAQVITGSANWSLASYQNYNENILFFTGEGEITARFQREFNRVWTNSNEFGVTTNQNEPVIDLPAVDQTDLEVFFNSPRKIDRTSTEVNDLTGQVVRLIDGAQSKIQIASTRVRLVPVLEALKKAADRGVQIQILISQDDVMDIGKRAAYLLTPKNLELRVKFYNLLLPNYLSYQMHNKFMIVDGQKILTGSFNWSLSSENSHIENLIELNSSAAQQVLPTYQTEFAALWDMGRTELAPLRELLTKAHDQGVLPACAITPMSLSVSEMRSLLKLSPKCQ